MKKIIRILSLCLILLLVSSSIVYASNSDNYIIDEQGNIRRKQKKLDSFEMIERGLYEGPSAENADEIVVPDTSKDKKSEEDEIPTYSESEDTYEDSSNTSIDNLYKELMLSDGTNVYDDVFSAIYKILGIQVTENSDTSSTGNNSSWDNMQVNTSQDRPWEILSASDTSMKELNPVILDVDLADIDDPKAIRIATQLDNLGYCSLKAVMLSSSGYANSRAVHSLLTYDGYSTIPVGTSTLDIPESNDYWGVLWNAYNADDTLITKDAVQLYKEILNTSTNKVKIVVTGYNTNIAELMRDNEGYELLKNKCSALHIVGGAWPNGVDNNFSYAEQAGPAIKYVISHSPVPMIFNTSATLGNLTYGLVMCGADLYNADGGQLDPLSKTIGFWHDTYSHNYDNLASDELGVWAACVPSSYRAMNFVPCNISFNEGNVNTFDKTKDANCQVVELTANGPSYYKKRLNYLLTNNLRQKHPELNIKLTD